LKPTLQYSDESLQRKLDPLQILDFAFSFS
jgi:hypothetical protein